MREYWLAMLAGGDARQRMLALRMLNTRDDVASLRATHRRASEIAARAPDDPLLAIMLLGFCARLPEGCSAAEQGAWSRAEPDNVAARIAMLPDAEGDPARLDALLAQAAALNGYDSHHLQLAQEILVAFDGYPAPPIGPAEARVLRKANLPADEASLRTVSAMGAVAAAPMVDYGRLLRACKPPLPTRRGHACDAVLRRVAGGTTLLERGVALRGLERLHAGSAQGMHWETQARQLQWLSRSAAQLPPRIDFINDVVRFGEIEAVRRALLRHGKPLQAPIGWKP